MATALVHIKVRPGMETRFEQVVTEMFRATHADEPAMRRYEYFRGAERATYYCLMSFDDYHGFLTHQSSDHHEAASPELRELTESIDLQWVDPIQQASSLVPTDPQPLPPDASPVAARHHERFGDVRADWWLEVRAEPPPRKS